MPATAEVPVWAVFLVSLGTPLLTFVGVLLGNKVASRGAAELERRSKREETMRVLRWAAELAVSEDEAEASLGVAELNALGDSSLLDDDQQLFVDAALNTVVADPADDIEEAGPDAVVSVGGASLTGEGTLSAQGVPGHASPVVPLERGIDEDGSDDSG